MSHFNQRPAERLPYAVDWGAWLPAGDSLESAEWLVPSGLTVTPQGLSGTVHHCLVSGGTPGTTYELVSQVETTAGLKAEEPMRIHINDLGPSEEE